MWCSIIVKRHKISHSITTYRNKITTSIKLSPELSRQTPEKEMHEYKVTNQILAKLNICTFMEIKTFQRCCCLAVCVPVFLLLWFLKVQITSWLNVLEDKLNSSYLVTVFENNVSRRTGSWYSSFISFMQELKR